MEWGIKIVVLIILLIIFMVVAIGLMMTWSGQSNDAFSGVIDFLNSITPG